MNWTDVPRDPEAYWRFVESSRQEADVAAEGLEPNFDYDDGRVLGEVSAEAQAAGAIPFLRSYLVPQFETSVPGPLERDPSARLTVVPGDVEPLTFGLYALRALEGVTVEVGAWDGASPGTFEVARVECAPVRHGGSSAALQWQRQPIRLWPTGADEAHKASANQTLQFWGTLRVDADAPAGHYSFEICLRNGSSILYRLPVSVEVLPFHLPPVKAAYGVYEAAPLSDAEIADLVDHGCNSCSMWARWPAYAQGSERYDLRGLDAYLARLKASGLGHSWVWYVATKSHERFQIGEELGEEGMRLLLKELDAGVASGRYPANVSLTIDEAICNYAGGSRGDQSTDGTVGNRWDDFVNLMAWMKEDGPNLKRFGVSLNRHEDAVLHEGLIDILSCNGSLPENGAWCREEGLAMYSYGSFNKATYPAQSRYNAGFFPWLAGANGTYCWAYKWSVENPFNDLDGGVMDWVLVYPGPGDSLISTPAWEAWREGVKDRRYLELYEGLVDDGRADGVLLDRIRHDLAPDALMEEERVGDSLFGAVVDNHSAMTRARADLQAAICKVDE